MDEQARYRGRLSLTRSDLRAIIKNTLGNRCRRCGSTEALRTVIHHKKYEEGMTIKDLELLCRPCHAVETKKTRPERRNTHYRAIMTNLHGWATAKEISEKTGLSAQVVRKNLSQMVGDGLAERRGSYIKYYRGIKLCQKGEDLGAAGNTPKR